MSAAAPASANFTSDVSRSVAFDCLHTGEGLAIEYWTHGRYIPDALSKVNTVLRDFRTGDVHVIDPKLLDLLFSSVPQLQPGTLSGHFGLSLAANQRASARAEQRCGHAQPAHERYGDRIRLGSRSLSDLHMAALSLKGGGVGYYPQSDFVHVDVGPVGAGNDRSS